MATNSRGRANYRNSRYINSSRGENRGNRQNYKHEEDTRLLLDPVIAAWLSQLQKVWGLWKKSATVTKMLHEYFVTASNPYNAALQITYHCGDFFQSKPNSLSFTIMEEFVRWTEKQGSNVLVHLSMEIKIEAFNIMIKQRNITLMKMTFSTYRLIDDKEMLIQPIRQLIANKRYKEACHAAIFLKLHKEFSLFDFVIPLIFQDKLLVIEEFLVDSVNHQHELAMFLDNLIGKRNLRNEAEIIINDLKIPEVKISKIHYKPLSKLLGRLIKIYNLPPDMCPNLNQKRAQGALIFLIRKRYHENSISLESWREMIHEAIGNNIPLQEELIALLNNAGDAEEALHWALIYGIPKEKCPFRVREIFDTAPNLSEPRLSKRDCSEGKEENWEDSMLNYYTLSLPYESIILVESEKSFQDFLKQIKDASIVGIDCEWKPHFGSKVSDVALIQIATEKNVFIFDVISLNSCSPDLWKEFAHHVFLREDMINIGFGLHTDVEMIKKSIPVLGSTICNNGSYLDLVSLWKKLVKNHSFQFPYPSSNKSSGESLAHLVELCTGLPLDKSDQFSNWEKRPLRKGQIIYAALDAYCLLQIHGIMRKCSLEQGIPFDDICNETKVKIKSPVKDVKNLRNYGKSVKKRSSATEKAADVASLPEVSPHLEQRPVSAIKVVCDNMICGLGFQLRKCGIDTVIAETNMPHDYCIRSANKEGRVVVTKGWKPYNKISKYIPPGNCYQVKSDDIDEQLNEVINYFNITVTKNDIFSRCKLCNGNSFLQVSQRTMKELAAVSQRNIAAESSVHDEYENPCLLDGGFSSDSDDYSDEGISVPCAYSGIPDVIVDGIIVNKCMTQKNVRVQINIVPKEILSEVQDFLVCEDCGRCYWDGCHLDRFLHSRVKNIVTK